MSLLCCSWLEIELCIGVVLQLHTVCCFENIQVFENSMAVKYCFRKLCYTVIKNDDCSMLGYVCMLFAS